uniref:Mitochondrial carrier protein n=1 Tax=Salix viminalis TaxID=40686 RepID=A0A6N2KN46_SALVM
MKSLSVFERALIGGGGSGIAGAFTCVCMHPLDTVKTKSQTKDYKNTLDAVVKTFHESGILGFYSGVSAVIEGSTASSSVYFGKSILQNFEKYPPVIIPPTVGAMGNIVSSAITVPKELIAQQMQAGAEGRSGEVWLKILEKDGILGLHQDVFSSTRKSHLLPIENVCCGALAGAISASLTTPLDVVKTSGVSATVKQILKEEGWVGFRRGMGPRVIHRACFSALGYFEFETARLTILVAVSWGLNIIVAETPVPNRIPVFLAKIINTDTSSPSESGHDSSPP